MESGGEGDPLDQVMYLRELCVQCDFAAQAFDQRLDALLARCPALAADRVVAPQDGRERLPDPQVLRYFATDTLEFIFGDEVYLLHPMALALTTVNTKAEEALAVLLEPPLLR